MLYLSPRNRYLLVEEKSITIEEQRAFVLPESFKKVLSHYKIVRVVEDSNMKYEPESLIMVPSNMIEEIEINEQKFSLILENYILAVVSEIGD